MINWLEMVRHAEDWADGLLAGAATASLTVVAELRSHRLFVPFEVEQRDHEHRVTL